MKSQDGEKKPKRPVLGKYRSGAELRDEPRWYAVHVQPGSERRVKAAIERVTEQEDLGEEILEVLVPDESDGKKRLFPGYVLVRMRLRREGWVVVRQTPGVTGFVGEGTRPSPIPEREVLSLLRRMGADNTGIRPGESVRVTSGSFAGYSGEVKTLSGRKASILLPLLGGTTVDIDVRSLEKI